LRAASGWHEESGEQKMRQVVDLEGQLEPVAVSLPMPSLEPVTRILVI
jgi:hypothetical protein